MIARLALSGTGTVADAARLLRQFLAWWRGQLLALLPRALRRLVYRPVSRLVLVPGDDRTRLLCRGPAARLVDATCSRAGIGTGTDAGEAGMFRRARAVAASPRVEAVLALPPEQVLRTTVSYPAAAAPELRRILRHDIDRHTPFAPDEAWFDYLRAGGAGHGDGNRLELELLVAPRAAVQPLVERIESQVGPLDGVDVLGHGKGIDGGTLGANLLPYERRRRRRSPVALPVAVLAVALAGLSGLVAQQSLSAREALLSKLRHEVEEKRQTAQATASLRASLDRSIEDLGRLVEGRRARPPSLAVLAELTRALPDDTWVDQMSLEGNRVDIVGRSASSTAVVRHLEESPMFADVEFRSQVVVDRRTGHERFRVRAEVVARREGGS